LIARLIGLMEALEEGRCIIDVGGVGYLVHASTRTLAALPQPPERARVLVETQVREDAIVLYGFADPAERDWFRLLTTVQGVGGRLALSVLSALSPRDLVAAIAAGDRTRLTQAPGVGARLAVRMLTELREKAGAMTVGTGSPAAPPIMPGVAEDAMSALINLGYRRHEAQPAVARTIERLGDAAPLDALIRDSLKELAQRSAG
jgi:Holliday junction DNA helicase RuvA